jgi:acetyl esterase/lipase
MKSIPGIIAVISLLVMLEAQAQPKEAFPLWSNGAPGAHGTEAKDIPTLTPFWPEPGRATGAAMIICPGGGYAHLADHEGSGYAHFLNEQGIAAFVLKYRLGPDGYRHPAMLQDAARAVRIVRASALEWKLDPQRIGIIGSSAGGHVASTLLTHSDPGKSEDPDPIERVSSRPDLGVLCYAVITMSEGTHAGSRDNLLGRNPAPELIAELSNELHVSRSTPPTFLWHTADDRTVPVSNSLNFAAALAKAGVPFDLHIYQHGPHGQGLGTRDDDPAKRLPWAGELVGWLKLQRFVK